VEPKGFASPPCLRHEIDPVYGGEFAEADPQPGPGEITESDKPGQN